MKKPLAWERIAETFDGESAAQTLHTYRAKVPGGWLIAVWADARGTRGKKKSTEDWGGGVAFVPDPLHAWNLTPWKPR
jgi:hypothetical protein